MNRRPLSHPFFLPAAAVVLSAAAGCAIFEPDGSSKRMMSRRADAPEAEEAPPVGVSTPTPVTGTETSTGQPSDVRRNKKTTVDFENEAVDGELTRPDGEFSEARQREQRLNVVREPRLQGPSPDPSTLHHGGDKGGKKAAKEDRDDFDDAFGSDGQEWKSRPKEPKKSGSYIPPAPGQAGPDVPVLRPEPRPTVVAKPPPPPKSPEERPREREEGTNPTDYLQHYGVNPTVETSDERFSTFSADVDTGSYTIARSYLERGQLPPEAAVRVEEVVNAFDYGYRPPEKEAFAVQVEAFPSPNRKGYHVLHLGLKGREISASARKAASLVFTIDVSGSMSQDNRLALAKKALGLLLGQLDERDQVTIVVYGDAARVALPPTNAANKDRIAAAIADLRPEGSTNVQAGLELAYTMALKAFKPDGVNRVILCSDGVANNGITTADGIFAKVKARASEGITLTTVGFGMGDYNDVLMERLADQGDGQYAYVDKLEEARRIFVEQLTGTLQVIAKDVKLQLEFNPEAVARYRLLGFENRALTRQDFHDDKKDAGELGAGHSVTAVYEVKFKSRAPASFATFRARFKEPRGVTSALIEKALPMSLVKDSVSASSGPARLSLVAAGFAEKLRGSYWARNLEWGELVELWDTLPEGLKSKPRVAELRALMLKARGLDRRPDRFEREQPVASMDFDRVPVLR